MQKKLSILVLAALVMGAVSVAWGESPADLLENGLYTEQTVGDLVAAARIYKKLLADPQANKQQKAQAQFRLGMCYMKQRQAAEAQAAFLAVIESYPDQPELVAAAKLRLSRLVSPNPAALMPPDTKVYVEIGSPGHQVEKIVNMLKGTPLANPLAVIGGGQPPATAPGPGRTGEKSPAELLSALLNPSMLAEFKKVRGMAVGVSGLGAVGPGPRRGSVVPPPFVAALYPGDSDALRGILTAGVLMFGQQGEPIEGMQTVVVQEPAAVCAYDDNVMIFASTAERLTWSIKQYKGIAKSPSLATANKSFAKLTSAEARRTDALTVWVDVAAVFAEVQKQLGSRSAYGMEAQFLLADALADFRNIEGAVGRVVVDEKNPYLEAQVSFKEGHNCLLYNLVRTPHLSRAGFSAVPCEAVALVSVALGEAQRREQAIRAAQIATRQLTGLDIGQEIFANIEQLNFFVLPPAPTDANHPLAKEISPVVPCVGLAITSRDPQQTRQLLDTLLSLPGTFASIMDRDRPAEAKKVRGRYLLWPLRGRDVHCYVAHAGRSTVLALDPRVTAAAVAVAAGPDKSVFDAGPLAASLSKLPGGTSKLAVVNAGGVVKLVTAHMTVPMPPAARTRPSAQKQQAAFDRLAEALAKTNVRLNTVETPNSLTVRMQFSDLPPLGVLFEAVMAMQ